MKLISIFGIMLTIVGTLGALLEGDSILFGGASLVAGSGILLMVHCRRQLMRLVRWSHGHLLPAQLIVTLVQGILIPISLYSGYSLFKLGVEFSQVGFWIFGILFLSSFFFIPMMPGKRWMILPKDFLKHRLAVIGIIVSGTAIVTLYGNSIQRQAPHSWVAQALEKADHSLMDRMIPQENELHSYEGLSQVQYPSSSIFHLTSQRNPDVQIEGEKGKRWWQNLRKKRAREAKKMNRLRRVASWAAITLTVLAVIILLGGVCAGICMIVLADSVVGIIMGATIAPMCVAGIVFVIKACTERVRANRSA